MLAERVGPWICLLQLRRSNYSKTEPHHFALTCFHRELVIWGNLGSRAVRVHGICFSLHHKFIDSIFDIRCGICGAEQALSIGFVFGKEQRRLAVTIEKPGAELRVESGGNAGVLRRPIPPDCGTALASSP